MRLRYNIFRDLRHVLTENWRKWQVSALPFWLSSFIIIVNHALRAYLTVDLRVWGCIADDLPVRRGISRGILLIWDESVTDSAFVEKPGYMGSSHTLELSHPRATGGWGHVPDDGCIIRIESNSIYKKPMQINELIQRHLFPCSF